MTSQLHWHVPPPPTGAEVPAADDDAAAVALDPDNTLPRRIRHWAETDPERPFLTDVGPPNASAPGETYGQVWLAVRRWAAWLSGLGVRRGDRVVTLLPSSRDGAVCWLALGCLGALEVPVNPDLRGTYLTHVLTHARPVLGLVRPEFAALVTAAGDLPAERVVAVERRDPRPGLVAPIELDPLPLPTDPACVIYTSGTTGPAKGVVLCWAQLTAIIGRVPRSWFTSSDVAYSHNPTFHVTGRSPLITMADAGAQVVFREKFSLSALLPDVRRYGCTTTTAPAGLMLTLPPAPDDADNPLRIVYPGHQGALAAEVSRRFGVHVVHAYGSTEAGFPLVSRWPDDATSQSLHVRRGYRARIVDEAGADRPAGEQGELWIRPPARLLMFLEYLDDPDATAAAIRDGWYRTGDGVVRNADGTIRFLDRMKDTVRRFGENISSSQLEAVVAEYPGVEACAVVGVPDELAGQEILLFVLLASDGNIDVEFDVDHLLAWLASQVARHMMPAYVEVVADLPRTATRKVAKSHLLDGLDLSSLRRRR